MLHRAAMGAVIPHPHTVLHSGPFDVATGLFHRQCRINTLDNLIDVKEVIRLGALLDSMTDVEIGHQLVIPRAIERRVWHQAHLRR